MDESESKSGGSNSNSPAPFLTKTYEMVDDPITNSLVSWSQNGCSFIVWNPPDFAADLLPKYFKHNNFSSFVRQLNTYGFRKIDPDQWEFANEEFIQGQTHLLKNIYRRKPIHSHSITSTLTETERNEFESKIEKLKKEKDLLRAKLQRHQSENHGFEFLFHSLRERVKDLEHKQMQLMTYLAHLVKKPGFASAFMQQQSQVHNKKRKLLLLKASDEFNNLEEIVPASVLNLEQIEKLESSFNFWATFLYGIGEAFSKDVYDFGVSPQISADESALSDDHDLAASETQIVSSLSLNIDARPDSSGNSVTQADAAREITTSTEPIKANDQFWEQFLTENPTQEIQTQTGDADGRVTVSRNPVDDRKFWWNTNKLDNVTTHFGNLASAGSS